MICIYYNNDWMVLLLMDNNKMKVLAKYIDFMMVVIIDLFIFIFIKVSIISVLIGQLF